MDVSGDTDAGDNAGQGTTDKQTSSTLDKTSYSLNVPRWRMEVNDGQVPGQAHVTNETGQTDTVYDVDWLRKQLSGSNSGGTAVPNSRILRRLFSSAMAHRLRAQSPHNYRNAQLLKDHLDILYNIFQGKAPQETANPFLLTLIEEYQKMEPVEPAGESTSLVSGSTAATTVMGSLSSAEASLQAPADSCSPDKIDSCTKQSQQKDTKDSPLKDETQTGKPSTSQISTDIPEGNSGDRQSAEVSCSKTHLEESIPAAGEGQSGEQTGAAGDGSTKTVAHPPPSKVPPKKGMIRMGNRCYSCFECYNVFKNSIELRMHFLLHHPSRLPYIDGEDDILEARQVIQATVERGEHVDYHSISLQFPDITEEEFLRTKNSCMSLKDKIQTTVQGLPLTHSIKFVQNPMSVTTVDSTEVRESMLNGREDLSDGNRETVLDLSAKGTGVVDVDVERKPSCVPFHNHGNKKDVEVRNSNRPSAEVQSDKGPTQLSVEVKQEPNDLHEYGRDLQEETGHKLGASTEVHQNNLKKETVDVGVDSIPLATFLDMAKTADTETEKSVKLQKDPSDSQQVSEMNLNKGVKRQMDDYEAGYPVEKTSSTRRKNTRPKRMRVDSNSWEEASLGPRTEEAMQDIQQWVDQAGTGFRKETLTAVENSPPKVGNTSNDEDGSLTKSAKGKAPSLFKVKMCADCNQTFRSHVDLKMHVLRNHPEKLPLLNHGEINPQNSGQLNGSGTAAEEGRPGLIYCTECESTFKMFMDLKMHVMRVHPEKLPDFEWPNRDQMRKRGNPYRRSKRAKQPNLRVKRGRSTSPKVRSHERERAWSVSDKPEEEQFAQDGSLDLRMKKFTKEELSSEVLDLSVRKVPRIITPVNYHSNPSGNGSLPVMSSEQFTEELPGRKRGYRCSLCQETFTLLVERKMHNLQCHPEKLSDFELRDMHPSSSNAEQEQMNLCTKEVPKGRSKNRCTRKCPMCPKEFISLTMLTKHALSKHPGGLAAVYKDGASWTDDSVLTLMPPSRVKSSAREVTTDEIHNITATNSKVHRARAMKRKCPECDACFKALSHLKQHVLLEHPSKLGEVCEPEDEPPYRLPSSSAPKVVSCSECGTGFSTPIELKSHFLKQHPSKFTDVLKPLASELPVVKRFGEQFVVLKDKLLYGHMCEECGMGFSTQEAKMAHFQREHHGLGKSYGAALQLLVNARASTFRGKMHLCPRCGTGFSTEIERKRHVLEHHPGQFAEFAEVVDPVDMKMTDHVSHEVDKTKLVQLSKLAGYSRKTMWGIPCPANCETRCKTWLDLKKHVLMSHPSWFGDVCRYSQQDITKLVLEKTPTDKMEKSRLPSQDINTEDGNIEKTLSTGHRLIQAALLGSSIHQSMADNGQTSEQEHSLKEGTEDNSNNSSKGMAQTRERGDSMEKKNTRHARRHWCPECNLPFSNFLDLKFHVMMKHPDKLLTLNIPDKRTQQDPMSTTGLTPSDKKDQSMYSQKDTPHAVVKKGPKRRLTEKKAPTSEEHTEQAPFTTNRFLLPKPGKAWTKTQLMRQKQKSLAEEAAKSKYARKVRWQCPECKSLFDHFLGLKAHAVESHSFMLPLLDPETTKIRLDRKASKDIMGETESVQSTCKV